MRLRPGLRLELRWKRQWCSSDLLRGLQSEVKQVKREGTER